MYRSLIVVASLAISTPVLASSNHLTDVQYLQAARCQALFTSPALGKSDSHVIDALVKKESVGRLSAIDDRADDMKSDAARAARSGSATEKAALIAERDGVCTAYNSASASTMTQASHPTTTN